MAIEKSTEILSPQEQRARFPVAPRRARFKPWGRNPKLRKWVWISPFFVLIVSILIYSPIVKKISAEYGTEATATVTAKYWSRKGANRLQVDFYDEQGNIQGSRVMVSRDLY